jgi:hypothetical protein
MRQYSTRGVRGAATAGDLSLLQTMQDTCDRCSQPAGVTTMTANGQLLQWCYDHFRMHEPALIACDFLVLLHEQTSSGRR